MSQTSEPPSRLTVDPSDTSVARKRRDEIVTAAIEIISSQGLHRLSLAKIEKRTGMARGQLTYYFPTKEEILLAVFDRMLAQMIEEVLAEAEQHGAPQPGTGAAQECLRHGLERMTSPEHGRRNEQLFALIHTFMAQVHHREDYRQKLAAAHASWRAHWAADYRSTVPDGSPVSPEVFASIVMSLFQGLSAQLAVNPNAFDRREMITTCLRLLAPLFVLRPAGDTDD